MEPNNDVYVIWDYKNREEPQIVGMFDARKYAEREKKELKEKGATDLRIERWPEGVPRKKGV